MTEPPIASSPMTTCFQLSGLLVLHYRGRCNTPCAILQHNAQLPHQAKKKPAEEIEICASHRGEAEGRVW